MKKPNRKTRATFAGIEALTDEELAAASGAGARRVRLDDFTFVKNADRATPALF